MSVEFPPQESSEFRRALLPLEAHDEDERAELTMLKDQFLGAVGSGNQDAILEARQAYEARFPEEREAIEALFGCIGYLNTGRSIEEIHERDKRVPEDPFRAQTEYMFLLTHFVKTSGDERAFLEAFWRLAEEAAKRWGKDGAERMGKLRAATVTQVGLTRAFEELYEDPRLAHPDDDMKRATDLWVKNHPVQIKGGKRNEPEIIEVDTTTYPATTLRDGKEVKLFSSHRDEKLDWLGFNVKRYSERIGRGMRAYFVVVPYHMVDWATGAPSPELVEFLAVHTGARPEVRRAA